MREPTKEQIERVEKIQAEIRRSLRPGEPLLVCGPYGSGKFFLTQEAFRSVHQAAFVFPCTCFEREEQVESALREAETRGILLGDVDLTPEAMVPALRAFLARTSRTVAATAVSPEKVHPDLLPLFQRTVEL